MTKVHSKMILHSLLAVFCGFVLEHASAGSVPQGYGSSSAENRGTAPSQHCTDFNPQHGLDIDQVGLGGSCCFSMPCFDDRSTIADNVHT